MFQPLLDFKLLILKDKIFELSWVGDVKCWNMSYQLPAYLWDAYFEG